MVSVPLRGKYFETKNLSQEDLTAMFPSPCGVNILKLSLMAVTVLTGGVSVPLRGKYFETIMCQAMDSNMFKFPSPCGVNILKPW